jgi:hypothetical protein
MPFRKSPALRATTGTVAENIDSIQRSVAKRAYKHERHVFPVQRDGSISGVMEDPILPDDYG